MKPVPPCASPCCSYGLVISHPVISTGERRKPNGVERPVVIYPPQRITRRRYLFEEKCLRAAPRIHQCQSTVLKIADISRRQLCTLRLRYGGNLRVGVADRLTQLATPRCHLRKGPRCLALKTQYAPSQVLGEHGFSGS